MVRYLSLVSLTQHGVADVKHSIQRAKEFRQSVEAAGGNVLAQYWAVGEYDGAVVFEVPDQSIAATVLLKLAQQGNTRTKTMQVFDESEFSGIVGGV